MRSQVRTRQLALLLGIGALASGCAGPKPAQIEKAERPLPPIPGPLVTIETPLQWFDDGSAIVVGGTWLLKDGAFEILTPDLNAPAPIVSPNGRLATVEKDGVRVAGRKTIKLTSWGGADAIQSVVWLDGQRLYVHRVTPVATETSCRVISVKDGAASKPAGGCMEGEMAMVSGIRRAPNGRYVLTGSGEGVSAASVVTYDPQTGSKPAPGWASVGVPEEFVRVFPTTDGAYTLIAPCDLSVPKPCTAVKDRTREVVHLRRDGVLSKPALRVTAGTVPSPNGRRLAWVRAGQVCVGAPGDPTQNRCLTPPKP